MTEATNELWRPSRSRVEQAQLTAFMQLANARHGLNLQCYADLHAWSVRELEAFWALVWEFCGVRASVRGARVLEDAQQLPGARFFPQARLNYAENLLGEWREGDALLFWGEDKVRMRLSWLELREQVSRVQQALRAEGVGVGDRVAAYMPNMPQTIVFMLAAASLGAVFASASPDFGVNGVMDRFGQVKPKVLLVCNGYFYAGKTLDIMDKVRDISQRLESATRVVVVPYIHTPHTPHALTLLRDSLRGVRQGVLWDEWLGAQQAAPLRFEQLPFDHPLFIMFSSGTTGVPKCIVHRAGGVLLKTLCEHRLHADLRAGDRFFFFTTCGWMMWNWLAAGLASGATLMLYDGSPFACGGHVLWDYADAARCNLFGTSAKFIDAMAKAGLSPRHTHELRELRTLLSTGSPLVPEGFDFVYEHIKSDLALNSISGGTDILGCFVGGLATEPVHRGEIQAPMLGMDVDVWDDDGHAVPAGAKGDLVCKRPFPSVPLGLLNDDDGAKFRAAYFARFPGVWHHGDYIERTASGGYVIHGRSDATLNPGGVRIGTAEIYRQVEQLPEVVESVVIGQNWPPQKPEDVRVVLFVRLREGVSLDDALEKRIRQQIRDNTTPRHVPARIVPVHDIPRTKSNKIVELAVRNLIHGEPVKNVEALANPEALREYEQLREDLNRV